MVEYLSKEKCQALDELLKKFDGDEPVIKSKLNREIYFETENNLHCLVADGMVKTDDREIFTLTSKGFGTMTAMSDLSYVRKFNALKQSKRRDNFRFWTATVISILALIAACVAILLQPLS